MKKLLLTIPIILTFFAVSSAQTWDGVYVGGYGGGVFERSSANTSTVFSPTGYFAASSVPAVNAVGAQNISPTGFTAGGQVGVNNQIGNFFVGAEVDFGVMRADETVSGTGTYPCCAPTGFTVTQSMKTRWLFTARPRAGFAGNNVLLYTTAGLAVTDIDYQAVFTDTFANALETGGVKQNKTGWTVGVGFEVRGNPSSHLSVKGEYLYADFGNVTATSTNLTAFSPAQSFPSNVFTHSADLRVHIVRGGINYRF